MFNLTPNQLPLQPFSDDSRPLPEIIADGNPDPESGWDSFPLAYHDVNGIRYYAVQDWIRGVAQTENPRDFWNKLVKRLLKAGVQLSTGCLQLPYRATNGKKYQIDHIDAEGLYRITQRMGVNTGLAQRVLNFLAAAGAIVDGQRIESMQASETSDEPMTDDPDKLMQQVINYYKRLGRSDSWISTRIQSTIVRKRFTEAFRQALRTTPSSFQFADITDTMRIGVWKRDTQQLREEMGLSAKANVRDHGSELMLIYEMLAEQISTLELGKQEELEYEQSKRLVRSDAEFVGKHAKVASERLGIDIPTGRPLLPRHPKNA